jgi:hypothetical protein
MKKISVIGWIFLTTACAPALTVNYDYDKNAEFASYKTFKFTERAANFPVQELNRTRLLEAITSELGKKGITPSDNPDLMVDISGRIKTEREATAYNTGGYGYYGAGYPYGWGPGFSTTQINVNEYHVGTLFIDLIDTKVNRLVWQGRGERVIDENASAETREKRISDGVTQIFYNYPPKSK